MDYSSSLHRQADKIRFSLPLLSIYVPHVAQMACAPPRPEAYALPRGNADDSNTVSIPSPSLLQMPDDISGVPSYLSRQHTNHTAQELESNTQRVAHTQKKDAREQSTEAGLRVQTYMATCSSMKPSNLGECRRSLNR